MKKIFSLDISADEKCLEIIRVFFTNVMAENCFNSEDINYLQLCLNEVCENIIRHGYSGRKGGILIKIVLEEKEAKIVIIDRGKPFNLLKYNPVEKETLVEKGIKGKLGIRTIKTVCDRIYYKRLKGKNKTVLVKKINRDG